MAGRDGVGIVVDQDIGNRCIVFEPAALKILRAKLVVHGLVDRDRTLDRCLGTPSANGLFIQDGTNRFGHVVDRKRFWEEAGVFFQDAVGGDHIVRIA